MAGRGRKTPASLTSGSGGSPGGKKPNLTEGGGNLDYEMLKKLLNVPSDARQGLMDALFPSAAAPPISQVDSSIDAFIGQLRSQSAGSYADHTDSPDTPTNPEGSDTPSPALQVLQLLSGLKESEFGDLIFDKDGTKVWFTPMGVNLRYTLNKKLQVDANVFNSEIYLHAKRKFPKPGGRTTDSVSIRAALLPAFEFIVGHASEKLQLALLGKNITPAMLSIAEKLLGK